LIIGELPVNISNFGRNSRSAGGDRKSSAAPDLAAVHAVPQFTLRCFVCLDSGADSCVFPASFASILGLDIPIMPSHFTGGVGSLANPTWYTNLTISLGRGIQFNSYAGFSPAMEAHGMGLLGQAGFFEYSNVCFYQNARKFTIETLPPPATQS
jgi:hypothetical protein